MKKHREMLDRVICVEKERVRRTQLGQALIELAIALPVVLLLAVGVIDVGRYAYIGILVGNAARAGAAYGAEKLAHSSDTVGINIAAQNDFQNNGNVGVLPAVSSTVTCGCDTSGTVSPDTNAACFPSAPPVCAGHWVVTVRVTATGTFNSLFKLPGIPSSLKISRTSAMRVAQF